jgi:hypothetical protein
MKELIAALMSFAAIALPQSAIAQTVTVRGLDRVLTFEGMPNAPFSASIWTQKDREVTVNP